MAKLTYLALAVVVLAIGFYLALSPRDVGGAFAPSWLTQTLFCPDVSDYDHTVYPGKLNAPAPKVLVIATEQRDLAMTNGKKFSTGNHPVEMLVPMLHLAAAGFGFDIATLSGKPAVLEMWAMPLKDAAVTAFYNQVKAKLDKPLKLDDVPGSLEGYAAIFIPGGHGAMLGLPASGGSAWATESVFLLLLFLRVCIFGCCVV